jgi:sensor histidine kinase YesM
VILFGADGIMYSSVDNIYNEMDFKVNYINRYKSQDWYKTLQKGEKTGVWTAPFSYGIESDNGKRYISLSRIMKDNYTQDILGIIMVNFSEDNFKGYIGSNVNGTVTLLNNEKQTIFSSAENDNPKFNELVYNNLPDQGKGFFSTDIDGRKFLVNYYSISKIGWFLVSSMPYDEVMVDVTKLKTATFTINFIIFISFFIIALSLILHMTYPLKKLILKIRRMKIGDHIIGLKEMEYSDDVSGLVNSFEYMIKRVEELVGTVIEEQRYENELKYETLRAQINPHFLFNTLNTIKWTAMMGGSENVPKMISALGRLLEVSMNKGEDEITLKQELELTESYVYIENIKNNCSLKLTFDVDENTENLKILKLILQPIVENSIIHGFKNRKADDEIKIGAKTEENKLIVSVRDNGAGINKEKIDQILYSGLDQGRHKYSGIGLININERLRIKYGSDFGLKIESEENKGTTVSILLPIIKNFTGGQAVDKGTDS